MHYMQRLACIQFLASQAEGLQNWVGLVHSIPDWLTMDSGWLLCGMEGTYAHRNCSHS